MSSSLDRARLRGRGGLAQKGQQEGQQEREREGEQGQQRQSANASTHGLQALAPEDLKCSRSPPFPSVDLPLGFPSSCCPSWAVASYPPSGQPAARRPRLKIRPRCRFRRCAPPRRRYREDDGSARRSRSSISACRRIEKPWRSTSTRSLPKMT